MQIVGFRVKKNGKVKEYDINVEKCLAKAGMITVTIISVFSGQIVYAGTIAESLAPLIDVIKDLAEPVSYGFMIKGFMSVMSGDEQRGFKTIKNAAGGFLGIQFIPQIFKILRGIKF
jgi:hypothetical protein